MIKNSRFLPVLAAVLLGLSGALLSTDVQAQYYKGKTVTIIVGFSAGGGVDAAARVAAQFLGKHVAGNPKVIVKNMTGGASIKAQNFVYERARPDGKTVFFGPWFPVSQVVEAPGIRFKYQNFRLIAAMRSAGRVLYARSDTLPNGGMDPATIVKIDRLKLAGSHPTNSLDIHGRLSLELLGVPYSYVRGYRGSAKIRAAVLNGEVQAGLDSIRGYLGAVVPTMVKPGRAIPLWTFPIRDGSGKFVENPTLPNVPSILKVYRQVHGTDPSGMTWEGLKFVLDLFGTASHLYLGPPKMEADAVAALSEGIYSMVKDPDYVAAAIKRFRIVPAPVSLMSARRAMASLANIDPKLHAFIKAHVASGLK